MSTSIDLRLGDCIDVMRTMPEGSVQTCVTSPPYFGLRDYGTAGQIGLEATPEAFVAKMVAVFAEVRRVLRDDGTLWLNLGDSYNGGGGYSPNAPSNIARGDQFNSHAKTFESKKRMGWSGLKTKDLIGIPWRVAFALQADGWYLRSDIIWHKPNPMPESVRDRPTKAHEYLFLLSKSASYHYDADAIKEPSIRAGDIPGGNNKRGVGEFGVCPHSPFNGPVPSHRNRRSVWTVATRAFRGAHFATFPPKLIEPCILAGCPVGGTVLDPFNGAGTTGVVSVEHGRSYIGIDINPDYLAMSRERVQAARPELPLFVKESA